MEQNDDKGKFPVFFWLLVLGLLSTSFLFLRFGKEKPSEVKDDERIAVHFSTDTLEHALQINAADWGSYESDWSFNLFSREAAGFSIEAVPGQRFFDILMADSAAMLIARDYPHLFKFSISEEGKCSFRMAREQGRNGYTVLPTWLLIKLIDYNVLQLPTK